MTATPPFEVSLTEAASADVDGDGSIRADDLEFYDSGVWVSHAGGRDFFPYERVLRIRESAGDGDDGVGERRDAASGTGGAVDDTDLDVE
jgi:hypothetical protein